MRILIVDDDSDIRNLLQKLVTKWGYEVVLACDGAEAWTRLQQEAINFVITDWVMPGMDGLTLCKKIRAWKALGYIYIIFLTVKSAKNELIEGLEAGADDFVVKPVDPRELRVRIRVGQRILQLEQSLEEKNKTLSTAYGRIQNDLQYASKIQKNLLPDSSFTLSGICFESFLLPCSYVAGDTYNFFQLDENHIGFYLLDVAGHGVAAALLSVMLSKMLLPYPIQSSPLKSYLPQPPYYEITSPAHAIKQLNNHFQVESDDSLQHFTMVYGIIDLKKDKIKLCQAGHPYPILLKSNEKIKLVGPGGFPIGMLPNLDYEEIEIDFNICDRLILYSDGITESRNKEGKQFSEKRLMNHLMENRNLTLEDLVASIKHALCAWRGRNEFDDDVSILAIERTS